MYTLAQKMIPDSLGKPVWQIYYSLMEHSAEKKYISYQTADRREA